MISAIAVIECPRPTRFICCMRRHPNSQGRIHHGHLAGEPGRNSNTARDLNGNNKRRRSVPGWSAGGARWKAEGPTVRRDRFPPTAQ